MHKYYSIWYIPIGQSQHKPTKTVFDQSDPNESVTDCRSSDKKHFCSNRTIYHKLCKFIYSILQNLHSITEKDDKISQPPREKYHLQPGFTLTEISVVLAIISIVVAIATPDLLKWVPNMKLKAASTDIYSMMQRAKMGAIKDNKDWSIKFDPANNKLEIIADSGGADTLIETIELKAYKNGVQFGSGAATKDATNGGHSLPDDSVKYDDNKVTFSPNGTCNAGYVYLENENNKDAYAVGTSTSSGVIRLYRWLDGKWK